MKQHIYIKMSKVFIFKNFDDLKEDGNKNSKPLDIVYPQYMSSTQKTVGKGGVSGNNIFLSLLWM